LEDTLYALRESVAYVGSDLNALPWYAVRSHFKLMQKIYPRWDQHGAEELAERFELPLGSITGTLSRGNTLKLNICSAWATRSNVLLLDEPTAGLDPIAREELLLQLALLAQMKPQACIVMATHVLDDLTSFNAQRHLALVNGVLTEHATSASAIEALRFRASREVAPVSPATEG
jgi:ABC-2 type transport system ATP-binding protein